MVALAHDEVGHLELARAGRGRDHDVGKERPEEEVHLVLEHELVDDQDAAGRVGAVVLGHDLDRPAGDAAGLVDQPDRRERRPLEPPAVHRADPGSMDLEPDAERSP